MARLLVDGDQAWRPGDDQFILTKWIETAPFEDLLGLEIKEAANGEAVLTLDYRVKHANGGGMMHGGALVALADTAVAMAIKSLLPEGTVFATTELSMKFDAPLNSGQVCACARVSRPEGRSFFGHAELMDEKQERIGRFSCVFRVARDQGFWDADVGGIDSDL